MNQADALAVLTPSAQKLDANPHLLRKKWNKKAPVARGFYLTLV
jgi:hypothetical protein